MLCECSFCYLAVITMESNMNASGFSWKCQRPGHLAEDCLVTTTEQVCYYLLSHEVISALNSWIL